MTKIILRENDVLISDEKALATLINRHFVNITAGLDLKRDGETHSVTPVSQDDILKRFDCHQSILKIEAFKTADKFSFHNVTEDEVGREILRLDGTLSTPVGHVPTEMLKFTIEIHTSLLTKIMNLSLRSSCFPDF